MKKSIGLILLSLAFSSNADNVDCNDPLTTLEINYCAAQELELAEMKLANYLKASLEHHAEDAELVEAIKIAQSDWYTYMTSHCNAIYTQWRDGTIRGVMTLSCKTELTKQRTWEIWSSFLTYMDNTPAVLPDPTEEQ